MTSVPKTKRQEFLAARALADNLEEALKTLSNRLFTELDKAEREACERIYIQLDDARLAAIDKFKKEHEADYAQLDELRTQAGNARRMFSGYKYECDHKDERGESAVSPYYTLMSSIDDKPRMKCGVCGETWS